MTAQPIVPSQWPASCNYGHRLTQRNTAMDMEGALLCLECVAVANSAQDRIVGHLIAVLLDLVPMPTRQEVGA